jgi:small nuclear ribonucleoprotein (snRNP)-like protein
MQQLVDALGAGADVTITLSAGDEFRGVISAIAQDRFALDTDRNRPESRSYFTYAQVRKLTLANMNYKASGEADLVAVKRILYVVGTGKHVLVRTRDSRKVRGRIQTIGEDQFTLETGGSAGSSTSSLPSRTNRCWK